MKRKVLLVVLCIYAVVLNAQTFNRQTTLNLQVTESTTIYPFEGNTVTGIGVSGNICFTSEMGFVRFVVSDAYDDEYLVYESYRLFEQDSTFSFSQKCEESCFYFGYVPTEFKIYVNDAIVTINSVDMSSTVYPDAENRRIFAAREANNQKLSAVQNYISENGLIWVANHTKMSDLTYSEKVMMLGEGFRTYGFEYYSRGIYSIFNPSRGGHHKTGQYVANFDWRNRHGANNPNSPYFDDDLEDGTGWLSPLKCQNGCWKDGVLTCSTKDECDSLNGEFRNTGTCWIFSATAGVEAMANLYYNQHLDLDLAEQYISCKHQDSITQGNSINVSLGDYQQEGVPYESEWPYIASLDSCNVYPEPTARVRINGYNYETCPSPNALLTKIINHGPIPQEIPWNTHALLLVGWGTIDETTPNVLNYNPNNYHASDFYGATYLIYKDSFGQTSDYDHNYRDRGYVYALYENVWMSGSHISTIQNNIQVPGMTEEDVQCFDKDGDGYYYWGIGSKPAHCPPCPDEPDGDDSNPALGPLNIYGQCTIIDTCNFSFEDGWDGWVQCKSIYDGRDWWRHQGPTYDSLATGPTSAQDGNYYIYVEGSKASDISLSTPVVSPPIDFSNYGGCGFCVDFYYHMRSQDNDAELCIFKKRKGGDLRIDKTVNKGDAGTEWQHCTIYYTSDIEQIGFSCKVGNYGNFTDPDIAIDNITIRPLLHNDNPTIITADVVWDRESFGTNKIIENDIIIEDGAKLTITKGNSFGITLRMLPESKIIVKPGGKLILDGCTLDCYCNNDMWQGIQVWGDNTKDQLSYNGNYYQGYLEMKNNAKIKNAVCAVDLRNPNHWNSTGGIIHARNCTFENNAKAIHAMNYNQTAPNGNILNYNAVFTKCSFKINESYSGAETFYKHVDLANVTGVKFHGCDFSIEVDDGGGGGGGGPVRIDNVSYWTEAIAAYNAGFTVDGIYSYYHNGTTQVDKKSTFKGFHAGAYSVIDGAGGPKTFTVKDCEFSNNDFGVFAIEPSFATVLNSTFTVGHDDSRTCNAGIFFNSTRGFIIEENTFTKGDNAVEGNNYGVIVKNSEAVNELYRNTFEGLYCGNIAVGRNRWSVNPKTPGLTYSCNDNDGNEIDFYVNAEPIEGIQRSQGSMEIPASNTFSENANYHFYNEGILVDYYYNPFTEGATPNPDKINDRVSPHNTLGSNNCPSNYGGGNNPVSPVLPPQRRQQAEQQFNESQNIYNSLKAVYDSRMDGGSTTNTVSEVEAAQPEDMWNLRSKLLSTSPYLSESVLYAAADRDDVLPVSVLFEILLSNPDELKNDELIDYMANKNTPLPDYMIDILHEVASGTSARTVLLSNMARYNHEAQKAAGDIIRSIMNDSIIDRNDLVTWLGNLQDIGGDRDIISIYMAEGDFDDAFTLANMLPTLYNLEGDDLVDHNDYMQLITLYRALVQDGRTTMQLNATEKSLVDDIAYNGKGTSQAMAKSLLTIYNEFDEECPQPSISSNGRGVGKTTYTEDDISRAMGLSLKLNPNPANTWVAVDYTLPKGFNNAVITLTDSMGLEVYTHNVHGDRGQNVINLQKLPVGVYILTIKCEEHRLTEKVVVTR